MSGKSLGKNALLNGIKQACSILFPFISFAYCSRIFGADGLGEYSFSQSVVSYFVLLAALGIPNYAIREGASLRDNKVKLSNFINEIFTISLVTTAVAYVLLFALTISVSKFYQYRWIIAVLSIQIILNTIGTDWVNSIFEDYFYLAIRYVGIQAVSLVCLFAFVQSVDDIYLYAIITMLSNTGGNLFNVFYLRRHGIKPSITKSFNLRMHIIPILVLFCNSVAVVVYLNSDITMLGFYKTDSEVGVYSVSSKIYSMIKTLINAVIMVTVPRFSNYIGTGKIDSYKNELAKTFNILVLLLVPSICGMFIEADKILGFVAGSEYLDGIGVVRILSLALLFAVGACFFSYSILIPNRIEKKFLLSTVIAAGVNICLNFIFIPSLGIKGAAITTLIAEIIVCFISAMFSLKCIQFKIDISSILTSIVGGIGVIIVCFTVDSLFHNQMYTLFIDIAASVIIYMLILLLLRNPVAIEIYRYLQYKVRSVR